MLPEPKQGSIPASMLWHSGICGAAMVGEELLNKKLVKKDIEKDFRDWIFLLQTLTKLSL